MQRIVRQGREAWKGPDDVEIITFSTAADGGPVILGGKDYGTVYLGRMRFKDGSIHKVAIKRFKDPLSDEDAGRYRRLIDDLLAAGVSLPKTGMVRIPAGTKIGAEELRDGEWAQVSQAFASKNSGSKIKNKSDGILYTPKARMEAVVELTKVANSGHPPVIDIIEPFNDEPKGIIPFDLDTVVNLEKVQGRPTPAGLADSLLVAIDAVSSHLPAQSPERKTLYAASKAAASPMIRAALERILPE
jgi:hypothetical protein